MLLAYLATGGSVEDWREGREAEVYEWLADSPEDDAPKVLKLFFGDRPLDHAKRELAISQTVKSAGAAIPATFGDVVEHDGRYGVIFERIHGTDLLASLASRPWRAGSIGQKSGKIHAELHRSMPVGLHPLKDLLKQQITDARELTNSEKEQLLERLLRLPDGDRPYHGDFHPGNILVGDDGRLTVIDWVNAGVGDPIADVARSQLLLSVGWRAVPQRSVRLLGRWVAWYLLRSYTKSYFAESGADQSDVDRWRTVIAAARLSEHIPEETKHVLKLVRSGLAQA